MPNSLPANVSITPIPAFIDNYIWAFHNDQYCVVVDPGDAEVVIEFCEQRHLRLSGILITHHHADHTGGLPLLTKQDPKLPVIGPDNPNIKRINQPVKEGDTVTIESLNLSFDVIEVPGHTLDHIAFIGHGGILCGDTLFSVGCGRLFEGSPAQMLASLNKIKSLPDDTQVWCTHEYTLANIAFAEKVDPKNKALTNYKQWAEGQRENELPTLPSNIGVQKAINPFLRSHCAEIQNNASAYAQMTVDSELDTFTVVRQWKDNA